MRTAVIGAGWTGAVTARELSDNGHHVEVFERSRVVGGHSRVETINGVVYEPNGAHIFHTSNEVVAAYVQRFGVSRTYEHRVLTEIYLDDDDEDGRLVAWPPQVAELEQLPIWPDIAAELDALPPEPSGADFESFAVSLMGPTLYRLFIRDYTRKQWGREPSTLSSHFAPKRIDLRRDGYTRLFRDTWEFFPADGMNSVIETILSPVVVHAGRQILLSDLDELARSFDHVVLTGSLDDFAGKPGTLEWRGIEMRSTYHPTDGPGDTRTEAYVVNRPSLRVPYTRTVETKHATGQQISGTIVSEEMPGAPARHYPVHDVDGANDALNRELKAQIEEATPLPLTFAGRLANYTYIDQDQAIAGGLAAAADVMSAAAD